MRLFLSSDGLTDDCQLSGIAIYSQQPLHGFEGPKKIRLGFEFHLTQTLGDCKLTLLMSRDEAADFARRLLATAGQDESTSQHPTARAYE